MQLRVMTEPQQGATYDELRRVAVASEDLGFDAFFRSDHLQRIGDGGPGPGPTDAWLTLAALSRDTSRIRLGTMVTSATFRLPGVLAISVAQVDEMSGGRVEFGIGAGWYGAEHVSYGVPFPPVGERFDRLEEQLELMTGLWTAPAGKPYSFDGRYYSLSESPALPKPVQQPHPPVILGGKGPKRTPALTARFADEFNMPFSDVEPTQRQFERVIAACQQAGRDAVTLSVAQTVAVGRTEAEVDRRLDAIGLTRDEAGQGGRLAGTPDQVVERIGQYAAAGATRLYCQVMDLGDLDHLEVIATEVARQL